MGEINLVTQNVGARAFASGYTSAKLSSMMYYDDIYKYDNM